MSRLLLVLACAAIALLLTGQWSRVDTNAARALARHEGTHDLPRLGAAREPMLARLGRSWLSMLAGTQVGLLLAAVVSWFLVPADSGAESFAVLVCAWTAGQVGRVLGGTRVVSTGTVQPLRRTVPWWLLATWPLAGLLLLWVTTLAWGSATAGSAAVGYVVLALAGAGLAAWAARRALAATAFLDADVPPAWTESLRGEAVRAAVVLWPGFVAAGGVFVAGVLAVDQTRTVAQSARALGAMTVAFVLWVATLVAGWLSVRWHARRAGFARPQPRDLA